MAGGICDFRMEKTSMVVHMMTPHEVLAAYWERGRLPIDPKAIAEKAGIKVGYLPFEDMASGLYDPAPANGSGPMIQISMSESDNRQRFTCAHELGHHFLGHGRRNRDTPESFRASSHDPVEAEANRFAAHLLMPADYVKALVEGKGITSLSLLAASFGVSTVAMSIRLQSMGYAR